MIGKWDLTHKQYEEMPVLSKNIGGYSGSACILERPNGNHDLVIVLPFVTPPKKVLAELTGCPL